MYSLTALNVRAFASSTGGAPALALLAMETEEDSKLLTNQVCLVDDKLCVKDENMENLICNVKSTIQIKKA